MYCILSLGVGTVRAKLDLKNAYRIVPIHPHDQHILAITWEGETYVHRASPVGLRSAPKIFSAVAGMLAWSLHVSIRNCTITIKNNMLVIYKIQCNAINTYAVSIGDTRPLCTPPCRGQSRLDLAWWKHFLQSRTGSSFPPLPKPCPYSDASGNYRCGTVTNKLGLFQAQ